MNKLLSGTQPPLGPSCEPKGTCQHCIYFPGERQFLFIALSFAIALALYIPNLASTFIDWDLVAYRDILRTTDYWKTAVMLFTDFQGKVVTGYYAPIASLSLMLDKWLIGSTEPSARFTLFVNLIFHCINGLLVFRLLRAVGIRDHASALASLIFLIHPVQVSSVLWFSQRKGLLAAGLYLLAFHSYVWYAQFSSIRWYILSLGLFALALLTKPTVVVLPLALLAWKMIQDRPNHSERAELPETENRTEAGCGPAVDPRFPALLHDLWRFIGSGSRIAFSLLPFFLVAFGSGMIAVESEDVSMEAETPPDLPVLDRPFVASAAIWFYVGKALIPLGFSPLYPRWDVDCSQLVWWLPLCGLAFVLAVVARYRNKIGSDAYWCLANFVLPLLPAIGLVKFAYLRLSYVADHFMYLPMVGMAGLMAVSICAASSRLHSTARRVFSILVVVYIAFMGLQTWRYGAIWSDSVTFWSYAVKKNPQSWFAHTYLGHALTSSGKAPETVEHFRKTIDLKLAFVNQHRDLGRQLERQGNRAEASREFNKADNVAKTLAIAFHNLGNALLFSNSHSLAIQQYHHAIQLQPNLVRSLTNLGVCHIALGEFPQAVEALTRAATLSPDNFEAQYNLGYALRMLGDRAESDKHFRKARSLRPDVPLPEFPEESAGPSEKSTGDKDLRQRGSR